MGSNMKNDIEKAANRIAAKRIAVSRGKQWEGMSKEEKLAEIRSARGQATDEDRKKALNMLAKREAQKANLDWKTLPQEERRSFIKRVRSAE
jgi:hypothetical protein